MQAIIFANRHGNELAPLNEHYCPALLPVGNKAVIEFTLEDLADANISKVKIITSSQSAAIEKRIGNGEQWGLEVEYFLSREQEAVPKVLQRLSLDSNEAILLARGDMLRSPCIKSFVEFNQQISQGHVVAKLANQHAGLMMLPAATDLTSKISWPLAKIDTVTEQHSTTQILHGDSFMLDSLANYMSANQTMAAGKFVGAQPKGRYFSSSAADQGFFVGAKTNSDSLRMHNAWGVIGNNTWIDGSVDMQQSIVIGQNCLVGKACSLKNCLILDNTYVGQGLNVTDAIVSKGLLLMPTDGSHINLTDPSIIADNTQSAQIAPSQQVAKLDRLQAITLFVIGLMLAPLLLLMSLINQPHQIFIKESMQLNGKVITSRRWNINALFIARLPQLYWVITGHIALFGATPFAASQADIAINNRSSTLGLYGPLQLVSHHSAPIEERQLIEAEYINTEQRSKYWLLVLRSLFGNVTKTKPAITATK
ncbi:NDP-sugar synthase [Shewanella youngdeokensis]|uniref:Translation initiation factor eIF2B subunit gamma n=1 Tax=Shewanella youngdeokensis TaxID=2999068 RepID=A0ABZ0K1A9_9GAMM|nr:NDP-sugar synthase [Shewanella sp. DAU334]